jgi:hypothetical protein
LECITPPQHIDLIKDKAKCFQWLIETLLKDLDGVNHLLPIQNCKVGDMCHGNKKELASSSIHHHDVEGKNRKLEYLLWCNDHTFVIVNNLVSMVASISAQHKDKQPVRSTLCVIYKHIFVCYTGFNMYIVI